MGAALPSPLLAQAETVDLSGARAELGAKERKFPRKKYRQKLGFCREFGELDWISQGAK
jgi:hypothetical protein